jgi:CRP-like cAMP-binding protein
MDNPVLAAPVVAILGLIVPFLVSFLKTAKAAAWVNQAVALAVCIAAGAASVGVVDGLLKMSNVSREGAPITYTGVPPGAWFGEGTLLKREAYRYNIEALRASTVAGLPIEVFHRLLERSIPFNRYVMNQLNERLGQFIAAREIDRMTEPDARVARSLTDQSSRGPTMRVRS